MKKRYVMIILALVLFLIAACSPQTLQSQKQSPNWQAPQETATEPHSQQDAEPQQRDTDLSRELSGNRCEGYGTVNFTVSPIALEDIGHIEPMGLMIEAHVTPIDHGYFYTKVWDAPIDSYDVRMPADGTIVHIGRFAGFVGEKSANPPNIQDYRIIIEHSCSFYTIFIHVKNLAKEITDITGPIAPGDNIWQRIPVKAGQVIGKAGNSIDFSTHDAETHLSFIVPDNYRREAWKIHTTDFFDYFTEPLRTELLKKNIRTASPPGGKIDYDIDGKLIGTWFKENTNGYAGTSLERYWAGHLSVVYDALDPSHIIVSLGNFSGRAQQFGIIGNKPDPSEVSAADGIVKYELVPFEYLKEDGSLFDRRSFAQGIKAENVEQQPAGIVLFQLLEDRKLKVEMFPGKAASEVNGFTDEADIYER